MDKNLAVGTGSEGDGEWVTLSTKISKKWSVKGVCVGMVG